MDFSEKLISLRKSKGLSQEDLGNELNVSRQTISKWESRQAYPDFQKLLILSDYFDITLDELVKDIDPKESRSNSFDGEKLNSVYKNVNSAKKMVKWYLIIGGTAAGIVLLLIAFFVFCTIFVWK